MINRLPISDCCVTCCACIDSCKHNALQRKIDQDGYYFIETNADKCIGCGACEKKCPVLNEVEKSHVSSSFWAWTKNEKVRANSTSGGAFAQLALNFFDRYDDAVVVGATLVDGKKVRHISIHDKREIKKLQGSKYQQSDCTGIYNETQRYLKEGRHVLFSGTPCQVAAIKKFSSRFLDNLVTCEVICHGIPSQVHFNLSIERNKATKILKFRDKEEKKWDKGCSALYDNNILQYKGYFYDCFFNDLFLKPACYNCKFASMPRVADISIADGWGVQNSDIKREIYQDGISLVLVNRPEVKSLFDAQFNVLHAKWNHFIPHNPCVIMNLSYLKHLSLSHQIHRIMRLPNNLRDYIFRLKSPKKGWGILAKLYIIAMLKLKERAERKKQQTIKHFLKNIDDDKTFRLY